jgi:hypothetical protein
MAVRSNSRLKVSLRRRGSLFAAFAVIAGMAIVIAGAGLMLGRSAGPWST